MDKAFRPVVYSFRVDLEEAAGILVAEFSRMAPVYDVSVAGYHAPFVQRVLQCADLQPGERVLDLGCGTGNLALGAARLVGARGHVEGVDVAKGMVAVARSRAAAAGLSQVEFRVMDARRLGHPDASFDAVLSCVGLPFFDWRPCFRQVRRVLRPGGRLAFVEWMGKGTPMGRAFSETLETFRGTARPPGFERIREARRTLRERPEARIESAEDWRRMLEETGFEVDRCAPETLTRVFPSTDGYIEYMAAFGDVNQELAAMRPEARESFRRAFAARVALFVQESELVVPSEVLICSARK